MNNGIETVLVSQIQFSVSLIVLIEKMLLTRDQILTC